MITDRSILSTKIALYGCLVSIFTVRINSKSFPWAIHHVHESYLPKFLATSDVQYCYCVNQHAAMLPGGPTWKKSRLNWKLKISNTAFNADITESQAREARHRRMQEVNSLYTDSGSLRAEYCIVAFHTIQPSSLKMNLSISQVTVFHKCLKRRRSICFDFV